MATAAQKRLARIVAAQRARIARLQQSGQTQTARAQRNLLALQQQNRRLRIAKRNLRSKQNQTGDGAGAVPLILGAIVVFSFLLRKKGKRK